MGSRVQGLGFRFQGYMPHSVEPNGKDIGTEHGKLNGSLRVRWGKILLITVLHDLDILYLVP